MSLEKNLCMVPLLEEYGELLSKKQFDIMADYFFADKTLTEIAENNSISRQAVLDAIKKCEEKLQKFENCLHTVENKNALSSLIADYKCARITKVDFINKISNLVEEL